MIINNRPMYIQCVSSKSHRTQKFVNKIKHTPFKIFNLVTQHQLEIPQKTYIYKLYVMNKDTD